MIAVVCSLSFLHSTLLYELAVYSTILLLMDVSIYFFSFDACAFDVRPKKPLPDLGSRKCTPVSKDFIVLVFIFVLALF